jgi:hypothetical protein
MTLSAKIGVVTISTVVVAALCIVSSILAAGVGHGSYMPFAMLFPFAFLTSTLLGDIGPIARGLAIIQFPVYGFILRHAWYRGRLRSRATILAIVHGASAAVIATAFRSS